MSPRVPTEQRAAAAIDPDAPPDELSARALRRDLRDLHAKVDVVSDTVVERVLPTITNTCDDVRTIKFQLEQVLAIPYPASPPPPRIPWWLVLVVLASPAISLVGAYLVTRS